MKSFDVNYSGQIYTVEAIDESDAIAKVRATQSVDTRISPVVTESVAKAAEVETQEDAPGGDGEGSEGSV